MRLNKVNDVEKLRAAIRMCEHDVYLRSVDGTIEFNMKSALSEYIALGVLCDKHGDEYEIFAQTREDESILLGFFESIR